MRRLILLIVACVLLIPLSAAQPTGSKQPQIKIENGEYYVYYREKPYAGPFQYAYILDVVESEVMYIEQRSGDFYLHWGRFEYGPFEEVVVEGVYEDKIFLYYRVNGRYYVQWGQPYGPYDGVRHCRFENEKAKCDVRSGLYWTYINIRAK